MTIEQRVIKWFLDGDTGVSSVEIVRVMMGHGIPCKWRDYPSDSGDFGRCYRLLELIPEFKERIGEMRKRSDAWGMVADAWPELTDLYEGNTKDGMDKIREVIEGIESEIYPRLRMQKE